MSNILMIPASGAIIFDSQSPNSSVVSPLSAAPRLAYDNAGGLNITSYTVATSALDRFSIDGSAGRLLSVSDTLTGTIFSVNDAAGLPIIQVDSNLIDIVNIGTFGSNALVVNNTQVGIGIATPTHTLHVVGSGAFTGTLSAARTVNSSLAIPGTNIINWSLADSFFRGLTASTTFTFISSLPGQRIRVAVSNTAANYTVTWPTTLRWPASAAPTQTIGVKTDIYTFVNINNLIYGSVVANY